MSTRWKLPCFNLSAVYDAKMKNVNQHLLQKKEEKRRDHRVRGALLSLLTPMLYDSGRFCW